MLIAVIILSVLSAGIAGYCLLLKRDLKRIREDFDLIVSADTNKRLTSLSFDKDVCGLEKSVNALLDKQKNMIVQSEKLNNELRSAITNISHDLKTPLTSASGYIQMLKDDKLTESKRAEYLSIVASKLHALNSLIAELFEFSLISEGRLPLHPEKVNVCNILRDSLSLFYEEFETAGFEVITNISDEPVYAVCDAGYLQRIFQNLLKNILVHGSGRVEINISKNCEIEFKNMVNGSGLDASKLFDRFYTADSSRAAKSTGLGLAIAKELLLNMGGNIKAQTDGDCLILTVRLAQLKIPA